MNTTPLVRALVVVPVATESTPTLATEGLAVRARSMLTGTCRCGGVREGTTIEHENDCPAISSAVERAVADGRVGWLAIKALVPADWAHASMQAAL